MTGKELMAFVAGIMFVVLGGWLLYNDASQKTCEPHTVHMLIYSGIAVFGGFLVTPTRSGAALKSIGGLAPILGGRRQYDPKLPKDETTDKPDA